MRSDLLDRHIERDEHPSRQTFLLTDEPAKELLGACVVVLEGSDLVLSQNHHLAGFR